VEIAVNQIYATVCMQTTADFLQCVY